MSQPPDNLDEVVRLLLETNAETASDEELRRLNQLLRDDPDLRRRTAQYLQDEALLREELATVEAGELFQHEAIAPKIIDDASPDPASRAPATRGRFWIWMSVLAASILFALLANIVLILRTNGVDEGYTAQESERGKSNTNPVVGTLTYAVECKWSKPLFLGDHLTAGDVRLEQGLARVNLTNGVVLVIKGPADLRLASADHILVNRGHVIANVSEEAIGFRLETPTTNVIDVGTEFSVSVNDKGHSEVQVLDGAVTCLPRKGDVEQNPPLFTVGSATVFEAANDARGRSVPSRADEFRALRQQTNQSSASGGELLAYEGFDYPIGQIGGNSNGSGWTTPWLLGFDRSQPANVVVRSGRNLHPPNWLAGDATSYSVQPTGSLSRRGLASPLDLDMDADYYISFLIRKRIVGTTTGEEAGGGVTLFTSGDKSVGLAVSIDTRERVTCWTGEERYKGGTTLAPNATYLVVMKISAHTTEPDNVFARAYRSSEPLDVIEPKRWDSTGRAAQLHGKVDVLTTWSGDAAVTLIDEIRVGTSWRSVIPLR